MYDESNVISLFRSQADPGDEHVDQSVNTPEPEAQEEPVETQKVFMIEVNDNTEQPLKVQADDYLMAALQAFDQSAKDSIERLQDGLADSTATMSGVFMSEALMRFLLDKHPFVSGLGQIGGVAALQPLGKLLFYSFMLGQQRVKVTLE